MSEEIERINSQLEYPQNGEELISNQSTIKPEIGIITALSKEYAAVEKFLKTLKDFLFQDKVEVANIF